MQDYLNKNKVYITKQILEQYSKIDKVQTITPESIIASLKPYSKIALIKNDVFNAVKSLMLFRGFDTFEELEKNITQDLIDELKDFIISEAEKRTNALFDEDDNKNIIKNMMNGMDLIVTSAMHEGLSNDELAKKISAHYSFSPERALKIARTETNRADNIATIGGYKTAGVKKKRWLTANDDKVTPECRMNQKQGEIGIDDLFLSGDSAPPVHPNCRCTILAVFDQYKDSEQ